MYDTSDSGADSALRVRKGLTSKVTDRDQLSSVTDTPYNVKPSDNCDGLKRPIRSRSLIRSAGNISPNPSATIHATALKAPRSKKTRVPAGNLYSRPASTIQPAPGANRLTIAVAMECMKLLASIRERGLAARRENHDKTARSERGHDPGSSAVRGGSDTRPPRDQTLPPAGPGAKR